MSPVMTGEEVDGWLREQLRPLTEELARYKAAVEVARKKGEHYPVCNMPPPEIRKLSPSSPEWRAWREANRGNCTCWKAEMEAKLK